MYEHIQNLIKRSFPDPKPEVKTDGEQSINEKLAQALEGPSASKSEVTLAKLILSLDILSS